MKKKVSRKDFDSNANLLDRLAPKSEEGYQQVSQSLVIRPAQLMGRTIAGEIVGIYPNPNKKYKNQILSLKNNGHNFAMYLTFQIEQALQQHTGKEKLEAKDLKGLEIMVKGIGKTKIEGGKRSVNVFEIYIK